MRSDVLSVRDMNIMIINVPSENQHVRTVASDDVDDSKIVEDVHVSPKTASITGDILVGSSTPIFDEAHVSSDSTDDDMNDIVESNIPALASQSSFLALNILLWSFLISHILVSHLSSLPWSLVLFLLPVV